MRNPLSALAIAVALALSSTGAQGLASDRDQPMNIEADALRHDEATQVTVFTGNVVLTKGSIVLRGDTLSVQQRPDGSQFGTVEAGGGRRAFFSQQRDTPKGAPVENMEAEAVRIEYDSQADRVRLLNRAQLRRYQAGKLNDEITGSEIIYHNRTGVFTVDGAKQGGDARGGRVRAVIGASTTGGAGVSGSGGAATSLKPGADIKSH